MPRFPMKAKMTEQQHEQFYQELVELMRKYSAALDSTECLAIAANMVGKLVALQDKATITPAMAMEIVALNLEDGNAQAMAQFGAKQ